jgi:threonine aldolase
MIDFRSDVLTAPTDEMWDAMRGTQPGWVWSGNDATINVLEATGAELLGKEAAMLVPTCTMANLLALMAQGRRGTQVILEAASHIAWSEEWGMSFICGLFPRLLPGNRGVPELAAVEEAIVTPKYGHLPQTSLLCLENSHNNAGGIAVTVEQTAALADLAHRHSLAVHLDGARLFNAAAALHVEVHELAAPVDTVAVSLNKGLRAPYGALLCGPRAVIEEALINMKRLGAGSVHKAGILAAAGIIALSSGMEQAAADNQRAARLAQKVTSVPGLAIDLSSVQTNILNITVTCDGWTARHFVEQLQVHGVLALERTQQLVRFVTHAGIDDYDVERAAAVIKEVMQQA